MTRESGGRGRLPGPSGLPGPDELRAGLAALAIAAELVLVPFVLIPAAALVLLGRLARWRPHWLLLPLLGAGCWLAVASGPSAAGVRGAVGAIAAQSGRLARLAAAIAARPDRLLHVGPVLRAELAGAGRWLPACLVVATAEAALVLWLGWRSSPPDWRPGLVATQRRRSALRALSAGRTTTADGCALGLDVSAGRLAGLSWTVAERGILLAGHDEQQLAGPVLAVVAAAVRRRKTVLMLDLAHGDLVRRAAGLAAKLGVQALDIDLPTDGPAGLEDTMGRAIRRREVVAIRAMHDDAQAASALASVLTSLRDLGLRGDCLAWVAGCEAVDDSSLRALLTLGPATGTAILLSTAGRDAANARAAELLATAAGAVIVAEAVPGWFTMRRAAGQAAQIIQTVPLS